MRCKTSGTPRPCPLALLSTMHSSMDLGQAQRLRAHGVPVLEGARSGLLALKHLASYGDRPARPVATQAAGRGRRSTPSASGAWLSRLAAGPLDTTTSFALLADYGIPVVHDRRCRERGRGRGGGSDDRRAGGPEDGRPRCRAQVRRRRGAARPGRRRCGGRGLRRPGGAAGTGGDGLGDGAGRCRAGAGHRARPAAGPAGPRRRRWRPDRAGRRPGRRPAAGVAGRRHPGARPAEGPAAARRLPRRSGRGRRRGRGRDRRAVHAGASSSATPWRPSTSTRSWHRPGRRRQGRELVAVDALVVPR